jgi:hypothetical protein
MNTFRLFLVLSLVFMGSLYAVPHSKYVSNVEAYLQQKAQFGGIKGDDNKGKIDNISSRIRILEEIVSNAVADKIFIKTNGALENNPQVLAGMPNPNNQGALVVRPQANVDLMNPGYTLYYLNQHDLAALSITSALQDLKKQKQDLLSWKETLSIKYNEIMKPYRSRISDIALGCFIGFTGLAAYEVYFNKFEFTEACLIRNAKSLLATLAIIGCYLRK